MATPTPTPTAEPISNDPVIDAMTTGYRWILNADRTIDWSISNGFNLEFWTNPSATVQQIEEALDQISYFANVRFNYVGSFLSPSLAAAGGSELNFSTDGSNRFFTSNSQWARGFFPTPQSDTAGGYTGAAGDVYLNIRSSANTLASYEPGSVGFALLLHEIGHALGLKHPHDDGGTGRPTFASLDLEVFDNDWATVMSYNDNYAWNQLSWHPASPMVLDVLALQALYGKNMSTNAGSGVYSLGTTNFVYTIWDAAGTDAVSASGATAGWTIYLPNLQLSNQVDTLVGFAVPTSEMALSAPRTMAWLMGTIEHAEGSAFADEINGSNGANYLLGGAGNDTINGGSGNDTLEGEAGVDVLTGGAGADHFVLSAAGQADRIDLSAAQGDTISLYSAVGVAISGAGGMIIHNRVTSVLAWDADADGLAGTTFGYWSSTASLAQTNFADGFQPAYMRTIINVAGSQTTTTFHWGNATYDRTATTFDHVGRPEIYESWFKDGSSSIRFLDPANVADFSVRAADYDAQGGMTAYAVTRDDSSRTLYQFDLANTRFWSRLVEEYDPLGRMSQQSFVRDDGTSREMFIDTYDRERWATHVREYAASGAVTADVYYNADGSIFV